MSPLPYAICWIFQVSVLADDILKNVEYDALRIVFNKFHSVVQFLPTVATVLSPEVLPFVNFFSPTFFKFCPLSLTSNLGKILCLLLLCMQKGLKGVIFCNDRLWYYAIYLFNLMKVIFMQVIEREAESGGKLGELDSYEIEGGETKAEILQNLAEFQFSCVSNFQKL